MPIDSAAAEAYRCNGYTLLRSLFTPTEVAAMISAVEHGDRVGSTTRGNADASGRTARLAIWHELGNDVWAAASTCPRVVNSVRSLMGEDVAFFHGKVMLKEARQGGAWEWHQDYGYWYDQGFMYPNMMSVFVALDAATTENGCLQVLRGSHKLGRLEHGKVGTQTGADPGRIDKVAALLERAYVEMQPGDALFFHCNLLHASGPNNSPMHRRSFIVCYTGLDNPQFAERPSFNRVPCPVGSDNAILKVKVTA